MILKAFWQNLKQQKQQNNMGWKAMAFGRGFGDDDELEKEIERAYHKGRKDAMEEMGNYGERGYSPRGDWHEESEYGERRGVKGTGPYSRYRYR